MIYEGILKEIDGNTFIINDKGEKFLESKRIWHGYVDHWKNKKVCARFLSQHDYETGSPIVLLWPDEPRPAYPYFELYYNERLVMYPLSFCGHISINVNNEVFNFSYLLNEVENLSLEEYFYRPALGEFAPAPMPNDRRVNLHDKKKPYYDKFGRNFMRTIHVIRVENLDTAALSTFFHNKVRAIHSTPVNPKKPGQYTGFKIFNESCTSIIRDGLRRIGFPGIKGMLPRDLFISAATNLLKEQKKGHLKITFHSKPQLKVKEAPNSALTPPFNPINRFRLKKLQNNISFRVDNKQIIAHRGAHKHGLGKPNSMTAFKDAIKKGCAAFECDVLLSKDKQVVVAHGPGSGHDGGKPDIPVHASTYEQLSQVDLGNGDRIPLLADVLRQVRKQDNAGIVIEVKKTKDGQDLELARNVYQIVKDLDAQERVQFISFSYEQLLEILKKDKSLRCSPLEHCFADVVQYVKDGMWGVDFFYDTYNDELVQACKDAGLKLNTWTVNKAALMKKFKAWGFDFITTDEPEKCLKVKCMSNVGISTETRRKQILTAQKKKFWK
jgi:glycerophosphoryl diester phosphodiesterase